MVEWKDVAERVLPVAIVGGVTIFLLSQLTVPSPPPGAEINISYVTVS